MSNEKEVFVVEDMHCDACVNTITKTLTSTGHVSNVDANLFSKEYNIKKVDYIDIPPMNAYQNIKSIISRIKGIQGYNSEDCIILVSAGPAGKIISYNLTLCDCFVIDTGHCWDDPLTE